MKNLFKKKWFWILVALLIMALAIIFWNRKVEGSKGGILEGASHKNGGIKTKIRSTGETVYVEGGEDVLTKNVNLISDRYVCEGTPKGIASSLNVIGGGVKFSNDGNCTIKNY